MKKLWPLLSTTVYVLVMKIVYVYSFRHYSNDIVCVVLYISSLYCMHISVVLHHFHLCMYFNRFEKKLLQKCKFKIIC